MSDVATRLVSAIRENRATEPSSEPFDAEAAYHIQDRVVDLLADGQVEAWKLGLTSPAKQRQMSVSEPLYGRFLPGSRLERGEALLIGSLIQPRVEPEIAFMIGRELGGGGVGVAEVAEATSWVAAALDVLDSRYAGYRFTLPDVIADNSSAARYAVGDPVPWDGQPLDLVGTLLEVNGQVVDTAAGAAVMGHPAEAVAWLVRKLHSQGRVLPASSLVISGSPTAAVAVGPGDHVLATVDRVGEVELRCEA